MSTTVYKDCTDSCRAGFIPLRAFPLSPSGRGNKIPTYFFGSVSVSALFKAVFTAETCSGDTIFCPTVSLT